ncbi:MAG: hypothetical protein QM628_15565 [Propionicimonas sp.]
MARDVAAGIRQVSPGLLDVHGCPRPAALAWSGAWTAGPGVLAGLLPGVADLAALDPATPVAVTATADAGWDGWQQGARRVMRLDDAVQMLHLLCSEHANPWELVELLEA